jgi:hypothetical protein
MGRMAGHPVIKEEKQCRPTVEDCGNYQNQEIFHFCSVKQNKGLNLPPSLGWLYIRTNILICQEAIFGLSLLSIFLVNAVL